MIFSGTSSCVPSAAGRPACSMVIPSPSHRRRGSKAGPSAGCAREGNEKSVCTRTSPMPAQLPILAESLMNSRDTPVIFKAVQPRELTTSSLTSSPKRISRTCEEPTGRSKDISALSPAGMDADPELFIMTPPALAHSRETPASCARLLRSIRWTLSEAGASGVCSMPIKVTPMPMCSAMNCGPPPCA